MCISWQEIWFFIEMSIWTVYTMAFRLYHCQKNNLWQHCVKMMRYWGELPVASAPSGRSSFDLSAAWVPPGGDAGPSLAPTFCTASTSHHHAGIPLWALSSLTIHTVQLSQHARRLRGLIAAAQQGQQPLSTLLDAKGVFKPEDGDALPPRPATPTVPDDLLPLDSKAPRQPFQLRHSDPESDFYKYVNRSSASRSLFVLSKINLF